jgi:hypothetical protein
MIASPGAPPRLEGASQHGFNSSVSTGTRDSHRRDDRHAGDRQPCRVEDPLRSSLRSAGMRRITSFPSAFAKRAFMSPMSLHVRDVRGARHELRHDLRRLRRHAHLREVQEGPDMRQQRLPLSQPIQSALTRWIIADPRCCSGWGARGRRRRAGRRGRRRSGCTRYSGYRGRGDFTPQDAGRAPDCGDEVARWGVGASRSERWRRYAASGTSCARPSTCGGCGRWAGRRRSSVGAERVSVVPSVERLASG